MISRGLIVNVYFDCEAMARSSLCTVKKKIKNLLRLVNLVVIVSKNINEASTNGCN